MPQRPRKLRRSSSTRSPLTRSRPTGPRGRLDPLSKHASQVHLDHGSSTKVSRLLWRSMMMANLELGYLEDHLVWRGRDPTPAMPGAMGSRSVLARPSASSSRSTFKVPSPVRRDEVLELVPHGILIECHDWPGHSSTPR